MSTFQEALFYAGPPDPAVRSTDRETSRAADRSVNRNHREQEVLDALRGLVVASSAHEIQRWLAGYGIMRDKNCIARRLTSLVRAGKVNDQGLKPGPYGRAVTAYRLAS